jgi:hypothetical protein
MKIWKRLQTENVGEVITISKEVIVAFGTNDRFNVYVTGTLLIIPWEDVRYRDCSVGIVTRLRAARLRSRGSTPSKVKRFFSSTQHPDGLWGPPSFAYNGYRQLFPRGWSGRGVKVTIHLHLVPRLRKMELYLHSHLCLHAVVLN